MATQQQGQQSHEPPRHKRFPWRRLIIALIATLFFAGAIAIVGIIVNLNYNILFIILAVCSPLVTLFQWLFPFSSDIHEHHSIVTHQPASQQSLPAHQDALLGDVEKSIPANLGSNLPNAIPNSTARRGQNEAIRVVPSSVFLFNEPLTDPEEFYGRAGERVILFDRTRRRASTSIVGPRKIGKTWLLDYLKLVEPVNLGSRFHIGYLDATSPGCATVTGFTARALEELSIPATHTVRGLAKLEKIIRELKSRNITPVLCIDEFEGFSNREEFNLNFFAGLRAVTQAGLVLVVASKKPLIDLVGDYGRTSGFFNVFEQLTLKPFTVAEAEKFVQVKGMQAGFTDQERTRLLQYGQVSGEYWPLRLQLVGKMLLVDKMLATREDSARYRPDEPSYWQEFQERLEEKYRGVVR